MGKRINISQPVVLNTVLTPLSDRFYVEASDTLEQWHYFNTNEFKPDRELAPLVLSARLESIDIDTGIKYIDQFERVEWYLLNNDSTYTQVVSTSASSPYYVTGNSLIVRKNLSSESSQTIKCVARAIDPRDVSSYLIEDVVMLTASKDGEVAYPTVSMDNPPSIAFNVLKAVSTEYVFKAAAKKENEDADVYFEWHVVDLAHGNREKLIEEFGGYRGGQGTNAVTIDAMYAENVRVICRIKADAESKAYPGEASSTLVWSVPKMDVNVYCENGSGVDGKERMLSFKPIVNIKGETLSEEKMKEHMMFNFKRRYSTEKEETSMGWGLSVRESSDVFKRTKGSASVYADVYLKGAYEEVTCNGESVTHGGEKVFERN